MNDDDDDDDDCTREDLIASHNIDKLYIKLIFHVDSLWNLKN